VPLDKASIELIRERTRVEAEAAQAAQAAEAAAQAERSRNSVSAVAWDWLTGKRRRDSGEDAEPAAPADLAQAEAGAEGGRKPKTGAQLIREKLGEAPEPVRPDRARNRVAAVAWDWLTGGRLRDSGEVAEADALADLPQAGGRKLKTGAELIREKLSSSGARAPAVRARNEAVAAVWGWLARRLRDTVHIAQRAAAGWTPRMSAVAAAIIIPALAVVAAVRIDPWAGGGCPGTVGKGADCSRYGVVGRTYSALALMNVDRELDHAQWAPAKADLDLILLIRPNFAVALDARGEAEAGLGDSTAALADYDRALALAPDDLTTRAKRGQLRQSLGKTEQAAADFAFVYHADPSTPRWVETAAFVRRIDHSTAPPKVHKPPKRRRRPTVEAAPPPEPAVQTEPPGPPAEQPPPTEPSAEP
jgi:tetratricopeptide (TPR) repeat protein